MKKNLKTVWAVCIGILLLLVFIVGALVIKNTSASKKYKEQLDLGDRYLQELDYENAELCFKEAIEIAPKQAKPYIQLATVYVETKRYDQALDILDDALEVIPAKESTKVEVIKAKITEVEEIIAKAEEREETKEPNALDIAMQTLNLPYLSDETHALYYLKSTQYNATSSILDKTGIISADLYDYDKDGKDEILVTILLGSDDPSAWKEYKMCMLEQDDGGNWSTAAETFWSDFADQTSYGLYQLYSIICPSRSEVFVKDEGNQVFIYMEGSGISQYFADGTSWGLYRLEYRDQTFQASGEPAGMAGSDDISWACMNMDVNYEYEQDYIQDFVNSVHALDVHPSQLGWEYPIPDGDSSLRSIVRIVKTSNLNYEKVSAWQNSGGSEPLGNITVEITDFSRPADEMVEISTDEQYTAEIVEYPQNPDITYPQFGPSSPTVDAWNAYFLDYAAQRQQDENEMIRQGIENAYHSLNAEITYQEGSMVSIMLTDSIYSGGAHGIYMIYGKTIDLASDHEYMLAELLNTDEATAVQMVNDGFNQEIARNPERFFPDAKSQLTTADYDQNIGYYKTPEGIRIVGALYWLAPYAGGSPEITLQPAG